MSEAKPEPLKISRARFWSRIAVASVVGATVFTLIFWGYVWGWWWDGFYLFLAGMLLGQSVGLAIQSRVPAWRGSDGPMVIGAVLGDAVMVILWLSLPASVVTILGYVARGIAGAAIGSFFVVVAEFGRVKQQLKKAIQAGQRPPGENTDRSD
jgi:hypothetical protein